MQNRISSKNIAGENIKSIRNLRKLSQAKLGKMIGRDRCFIQRIESNGHLDARYLEPIATALNLDDPFVLTREIVDFNRLSSLGIVKRSRK